MVLSGNVVYYLSDSPLARVLLSRRDSERQESVLLLVNFKTNNKPPRPIPINISHDIKNNSSSSTNTNTLEFGLHRNDRIL